MTAPKSTKCPTCKGVAVKDGNKLYPFCGERCQLVDLGRWLNEEYRVPSDEPATGPLGTDDESSS
ncbi:MAG: DNA gyrase inhibitor YacG [Proteobacteria bacterium]|nr:DNA gyrase inhibitor YacG [Pseudomonadota bacterium]